MSFSHPNLFSQGLNSPSYPHVFFVFYYTWSYFSYLHLLKNLFWKKMSNKPGTEYVTEVGEAVGIGCSTKVFSIGYIQ